MLKKRPIKKWTALLLTGFLMFTLTACGDGSSSSEEPTAQNDAYTFTDDTGTSVTVQKNPKQVVSLLGSYAETWLLAGGTLAGTTDDAVSERELTLPESTEIIGTVKEPNLEKVLALSPDFVILSADLEAHQDAAAVLRQAGIPCALFEVEHFADYLDMLKICTDLTGRTDLYEKNGTDVQKKIEEVKSKIPEAGEQPTILFLRAMSTTAKAKADDNMVCEMLREMGTQNIAESETSLLEELSMEVILQKDPDYIFVTTMGDSEKALDALKEGIQSNPAWGSLSAVQNDRYIVLPKDLFHYKPNARWGESYEYLAKILYPEAFAG